MQGWIYGFADGKGDVPDDYMGPADRDQPPQDRDPLASRKE